MRTPAVLAVIAYASACGSESPDRPIAPLPARDGVELVSPGAEPRRQLRYHLAPGATSTFELEVENEMRIGGRGGPMPGLAMTIEVGAERAAPDGTMQLRTRIAQVTAHDRDGAAITAGDLERQTAQLAGLVLTSTLAPDGALRDSKLDRANKDLSPAVRAQLDGLVPRLDQLAMRLPDAAVGAGARWRERKTIAHGGVTVVVVTAVELTAIDGDRVAFTTTAELGGPDQAIREGAAAVSITNIGGSGAGSGTLDLARLVMIGEAKRELRWDAATDAERAAMAMTVTLRTKPAAPP